MCWPNFHAENGDGIVSNIDSLSILLFSSIGGSDNLAIHITRSEKIRLIKTFYLHASVRICVHWELIYHSKYLRCIKVPFSLLKLSTMRQICLWIRLVSVQEMSSEHISKYLNALIMQFFSLAIARNCNRC